jgi:hypothetical protein
MNDDTILTYKLANPDLTGFNPYCIIETADYTEYYITPSGRHFRIVVEMENE